MRVYLLSHKRAKRKWQGFFIWGCLPCPSPLAPFNKNSDNKIVAGCWNWRIKPRLEKAACSFQSGVVTGRQLIQNAVDWDYAASSHTFDFLKSHHDGKSVFQLCNDLSASNLVHGDLIKPRVWLITPPPGPKQNPSSFKALGAPPWCE